MSLESQRRDGWGKLLGEIMVKKSPNLVKVINWLVQEAKMNAKQYKLKET